MKLIDRENLYKAFKDKFLWKSVKDWVYIQCVSLSKYYAKEVFWVSLWSFGWSAFSWFENKSKTFDITKWKKVDYIKWFVWVPWDILFWQPINSNKYWHTAICGVWSTEEKLVILEQNYIAESSKDFWKWTGEAKITERVRNYNDLAWVWRFIW